MSQRLMAVDRALTMATINGTSPSGIAPPPSRIDVTYFGIPVGGQARALARFSKRCRP